MSTSISSTSITRFSPKAPLEQKFIASGKFRPASGGLRPTLLCPLVTRRQLGIAKCSETHDITISEQRLSEAETVGGWLSDVYDGLDYVEALSRADEVDSDFDNTADEFIYGEFDMGFFLALLDHVSPSESSVFVDLGSGRGQLVHLAAMVWNWKKCLGVEIVPILHELACAANNSICKLKDGSVSECEFIRTNFMENMNVISEADLVFIYATKMTVSDETGYLSLSKALQEALHAGTIVISVNQQLDCQVGFQLTEQFSGPNPEDPLKPSIAYVYKVCADE